MFFQDWNDLTSCILNEKLPFSLHLDRVDGIRICLVICVGPFESLSPVSAFGF